MDYILGVAAALLAQIIKKYFGTDTLGTYLVVFTVSLGAAGSYVILKDTNFWPTMVQVFVISGAVHNFIIRRFE